MKTHRILMIGGVLLSCPSIAATYCVSTPAELTVALAASEQGASNDEIRLRAGFYAAPGNGWVIDIHRKGFTLTGSFDDQNCLSKTSIAASTILDGGHTARPLTIDTSFQQNQTGGQILIGDLTIQNGLGDVVGGLKVSDAGPIYNGAIQIERIAFRNNEAMEYREDNSAGALLAATDGSAADGGTYLIVRNNLFDGNRAKDEAAAMLYSDNAIAVNNNTFVGNQSFDFPGRPTRTTIGAFSPTRTYYTNNIFWGNNPDGLAGTYDVSANSRVGGTTRVTLVDNDCESILGDAGILVGNFSYEPHFVNVTNRDFHLRNESGLIDAGVDVPPRGGVGNFDLDGNLRQQGQFIDLGAYENPTDPLDALFINGFE